MRGGCLVAVPRSPRGGGPGARFGPHAAKEQAMANGANLRTACILRQSIASRAVASTNRPSRQRAAERCAAHWPSSPARRGARLRANDMQLDLEIPALVGQMIVGGFSGTTLPPSFAREL